jgi:hypothetical protein
LDTLQDVPMILFPCDTHAKFNFESLLECR